MLILIHEKYCDNTLFNLFILQYFPDLSLYLYFYSITSLMTYSEKKSHDQRLNSNPFY